MNATDEQRAERIHHHMYDTCEGIREHAERIVALEELVKDMYEAYYYERPSSAEQEFAERMTELDVPRW